MFINYNYYLYLNFEYVIDLSLLVPTKRTYLDVDLHIVDLYFIKITV